VPTFNEFCGQLEHNFKSEVGTDNGDFAAAFSLQVPKSCADLFDSPVHVDKNNKINTKKYKEKISSYQKMPRKNTKSNTKKYQEKIPKYQKIPRKNSKFGETRRIFVNKIGPK